MTMGVSTAFTSLDKYTYIHFRFSESKDYIEMNQDKLIDVFNKNFPWIFNIDQIMSDEAKVKLIYLVMYKKNL